MAQRWDHVFQNVLRDVLSKEDEPVIARKSRSVGSERVTIEELNYKFELENPRDRILWNPVRQFNLYGAIARFFWMISGNDRLKDIAFYEPKALGFSDDAMTIQGSNYGTRLFMPEPGLDQIKAVVERLREDAGTRRAVAVIYRPEDAVRDSKDIPCAFGLGFHARNGHLHMTMIMRSNAAWTLLPYNIFEFTLLGELVSVMTDLPLGGYAHFALSMHIYKDDNEKSDEVTLTRRAVNHQFSGLPPVMSPMPHTEIEDLRRLSQWETELRYEAKGINITNYRDYLKKCRDEFDPYWAELCLPLLAYVLFINKKIDAGMTVLEEIKEPIRQILLQHPMVHSLKVPGLEEDPILLESRLNLIRYADEASVLEPRREQLWSTYHEEFLAGISNQAGFERRRQMPISVREWQRRNQDLDQLTLFKP